MAYRLVFPASALGKQSVEAPWGFSQGVVFQWVNPKIWAVALAASSGYSIGLSPAAEAARVATGFIFVNFFVCVSWTYSGMLLSALLNNETRWFYFRVIMALFLVMAAILVFL